MDYDQDHPFHISSLMTEFRYRGSLVRSNESNVELHTKMKVSSNKLPLGTSIASTMTSKKLFSILTPLALLSNTGRQRTYMVKCCIFALFTIKWIKRL